MMLTEEVVGSTVNQTVTDLMNKMKNKSFTDGWDVACAYRIDRLNTVLANLFNDPNSKIVKSVSLGSQEKPYSQTYTIVNVPGAFTGLSLSITENYTFNLGQPVLQFLSTTNIASLQMPILSALTTTSDCSLSLCSPQPQNVSELLKPNTWYKLDPTTQHFSEATVQEVNKAVGNDSLAKQFYIRANDPSLNDKVNYQNKAYQLVHIESEAPKSLLDGEYVLEAIVPIVSLKGDRSISPGNQVISFGTMDKDGVQIVLHFTTGQGSGTEFAIYKGGVVTNPTFLEKAPDILYRIQNYFASQAEIDYVLTTVKNTSVSPNTIQLTPQSFRFATQNQDNTGSLTIFIQTKESGLPQGGANLTFQDAANQPFLPITSQSNTTLIYSRRFMSSFYFVKGLQKNGFKNVSGDGTDNTPISFKGDYPSSTTIRIDSMHNVGSENYDVAIDPVNLGDITTNFAFDSGNNFHILSNITKGTTIHLHWYTMSICVALPHEKDVSANIQAHLNKTAPLAWTVSNNQLSISFSIASNDYSVNVDSEVSDECGDSARNRVNGQIQSQIARALPTFSIPMDALSALAEVNLLFRGTSAFNVDSSLNVHSPQDIVLFGNI